MTGSMKRAKRSRLAWRADEIAELRRRVAAGERSGVIAAALGRHTNAVSKVRAKLGLPVEPKLVWTAARDDRLRAMVAAGESSAACGVVFECSGESVRNRAAAIGLRFDAAAANARRAAAMAALWRDPDYRTRVRAAMVAGSTPESRARGIAALRARGERQIAWCAADYREMYRALRSRTGDVPTARRLTLDAMAHEERGRRAALAAAARDEVARRAALLAIADAEIAARQAAALGRRRLSFDELLAAVEAGRMTVCERVPMVRAPAAMSLTGDSLAMI